MHFAKTELLLQVFNLYVHDNTQAGAVNCKPTQKETRDGQTWPKISFLTQKRFLQTHFLPTLGLQYTKAMDSICLKSFLLAKLNLLIWPIFSKLYLLHTLADRGPRT